MSVSPEAFDLSFHFKSKRALAGAYCQKFLSINSLQIQIINFMIFCILLSACKWYHVGWLKLFILFKICIADNDSWIYPKAKTFQELFQPYQPSAITSTAPYAEAFIFFVQIAIDFSQPFIFEL